MSLNILNLDWLNQNANRAYPLHEDATGMDTTGTFRLPKSFLVDLLWPIHISFGQDCTRFHLYSLLTAGDTVTLQIAHTSASDTTTVVGSVVINRAQHKENSTYLIQGTGDFEDSVGQVAVGRLDEVYSQGGGYTFDLAGARLMSTCIRPNLRGVSALRVQSGNDISDLLVGDVELVEGWNVRLTVLDGNKIRIDARSDSNLREDCGCDEIGACIKTINGVPPDAMGNFTLVGDNCITISPLANGLQLTDKCSKACCGCDELTPVVGTAESMSAQLDRLEVAIANLAAAQANFTANVLASRTNAQGC